MSAISSAEIALVTAVVLLPILGALAIFGIVLGARQMETITWPAPLRPIELRMPMGLPTDDITRWLNTVAAAPHAPRLSLLPCPPLSLEVVADVNGIRHLLLVPKHLRTT